MLDLNSLEKKLNNSLLKETKRSIRKWLLGKRIKERYAKIAKSEHFIKTYSNKSIGEIIEKDE